MSSFSRKKFGAPFGRRPSSEGVFSTDYVLTGWPVILFQVAVIAIVGLWIYSPAFYGDSLWDDDIYIFKNPLMNDPDRLWKAWFQPGSFMEYYPIQQTVEWWQWQLWHEDTFGYHLTNVCLHIVNGLLVWRLLGKLGLSLAWVGGLIFVAHPVNVESVAWIVELKNTLSMIPFLLAMCAWIDYENSRRSHDYACALGFFLVALLSKISMSPFPFIILLYAWWKRGRIKVGDLVASAPFFLVALIMVEASQYAARVYAQSAQMGMVDLLPISGLSSQIALVGLASAFYFSHIFLPLTLLPIYPVWAVNPPSPLQFLPWLVFAGILGVLWWRRDTWGRHVVLGLGFFLVMLAPVLTFGIAFYPRDSWVMDHFLYIPIIGIIGLVTAALGQIETAIPRQRRVLLTGSITLVVVLLSFLAHGYAAAFTNPETLWNYTLERNPGAWTAQIDLGNIDLRENRLNDAKSHFEEAIRLKPDSTKAISNLGMVFYEMGQTQEGLAALRRASNINPNDAITLNNLGSALAMFGQMADAQKEFEQATKVQPNFSEPYLNLGNIYLKKGKLDVAEWYYREAVKVKPDFVEAYFNLGIVLNQEGHSEDALAQFEEASRLKPDYLGAHLNSGLILAQLGRQAEAAEQFEEALQIDPNNQTAQANLARIQNSTVAPK